MRQKRIFKRFMRRYDAEFIADDTVSKGIATRLSEGGLFIRTQKPFKEGTAVEVRIYPPDMEPCAVKGVVKYSRRVQHLTEQNGMGIKVTERDRNYSALIESLKEQEKE